MNIIELCLCNVCAMILWGSPQNCFINVHISLYDEVKRRAFVLLSKGVLGFCQKEIFTSKVSGIFTRPKLSGVPADQSCPHPVWAVWAPGPRSTTRWSSTVAGRGPSTPSPTSQPSPPLSSCVRSSILYAPPSLPLCHFSVRWGPIF